jgi:hypothetical protein
MKDLRKILPYLSLSLSLGLLALLVGSILIAASPEEGSPTGNRFKIKTPCCEEQAAFARNAVEGEAENSDNDNRAKDDIVPMIDIMMQSRMISKFIPIIQNQLAATLHVGPRLTILLGQFIV